MSNLATGYILQVRTFVSRCVAFPGNWFSATMARLGLTGSDGDLSFTKTVILLVTGSYLVPHVTAIPTAVSYLLVCASHGTKVLLALINKSDFKDEEKDSLAVSVAYSKEITETIARRSTDDGTEPT